MMKAFPFALFFLLIIPDLNAQTNSFAISIDEDAIRGGSVIGYYHAPGNFVVINTQNKDTITHQFYDSAFNFQKEYKVIGADRRLLYAVYGSGHRKPYFARNMAIQNFIIEIYASKDSVFIYQLDTVNKTDTKIAGIDLNKKYKDETLLAVMPNNGGCDFLCGSQKKDMIVIHKWRHGSEAIASIEIPFLESTLTEEETIKWKGYGFELKNKDIFSSMSVSRLKEPDVFQFPATSQLFYSDNYIYIVNAMPKGMGSNVVTINSNKGTISTKNYVVNKLPVETDLDDGAFPVATIYDSLLIIQNWSEKRFEYYFYNLNNGNLIKKYQVRNGDSIYRFVHSPLRQFGTFGSGSEEKNVGNEKKFVRKMEHGVRFLKAMANSDSIVLTVGSFAPTAGAEGLAMGLASVGTGLAVGPVGGSYHFYYYNTQRNKFMYAHSRFSLNTLEPSSQHGLRTFLDDFITNKQMDELKDDNSILIAKPGKLYIGIYTRKNRFVNFTEFEQH